DDFGSGYSSLNVLKDYHFHTLKLDMAFLHPFTKESRTILTAIVRMAKELGVHTLAEGVETREQAQFLRDIGCEKLQGYYFGRPLPAAECRPYCRDRNLSFETLPEAVLLDKAGLIDVSQSSPVAIVYDDSQTLQFLQANAGYLQALQSMGTRNVSDSNQFLSSLDFPMHQKFRRFADRARKSGQQETMTYVDNSQYMRVNLKTVARAGHRCIHRAELYNISLDEAARDKQSRRLDNVLRNIILTYEGIWYLNMENQVLEIIEPLTSDQQVGETNPDIDGTFHHFAEYFVHPKDRERFLHFMDPEQFYRQAAASQSAIITEPFRILRSNGNFDWFMIIGMVLPKSPSRDILFFITKPPINDQKKLRPILFEMLRSYGVTAEAFATDTANTSQALWQAFLQHSREKVIWKDRSHRICGASQAFVEWLGIPEKELLGKTTQELGFCVDCQADDETDEKAMCSGQVVSDCFLHFVVKQQLHLVQADKFPIYQNDKMTGVVLCFHDVEDNHHPLINEVHTAVTDEETGFLNYRGMVMAGLRYADTYRLHGDDYTAALIDVPEFDAIGLTYGPEFRQHLLQKITAILKEYLPPSLTISHIGSCCFLLFQKSAHIAQLQQAHIQISNAIHAIQQVDGFPCTLYMHYAIVRGSEARSLDSLLQLLIKRMHESEEAQYGQALYTSDRFIFDRAAFDHSDLGAVVSDSETYELLYCNPAMRKRSGIPLDTPL
ncbi:MAG: EAL domain-containing protein, partial [Megasphaera elsdenii]|nr:EAL domain-containing protein [Megasphaera elsdenii]